MQISKLSTPSFGCSKCYNHQKAEQNNTYTPQGTNKIFTISRNALIATLTGLLTSCASEQYTFGVTPEGNPIIFNQDGDCLDIVPEKIEKDYQKFCDNLESSRCRITEGIDN